MANSTAPLQTTSQPVVFCIDSRDRVTSVNLEWTRFAAENSAPQLGHSVVGSELFGHIQGETVRSLWREILERFRVKSSPLSIEYRCDSPGCRRFMRMDLTGTQKGGVMFSNTITSAQYRMPVVEPGRSSGENLVRICSWCKRIDVHGWLELEEAVQKLRLFGGGDNCRLTHTICDGCHERVLSELG